MKFYCGTFLKVPLFFHWSAFLILAISFILAGPIGVSFTMFGILFVVLHEYGHVWMAQKLGWHVTDITIYIIGGVANIRIKYAPKEEFLVAIAGPIVSLILFVLFTLITIILPPSFPGFITMLCAAVNLLLVAYNALPILPMDGGRAVRSTLAMVTDYGTATWWTVRIGDVVGIAFVLLAFYIGTFGLGVITILMIFVSRAELTNAEHIHKIFGIRDSLAAKLNYPSLRTADIPMLILVLKELDDSPEKEEQLKLLRQCEHLSI